MGRPPAGDGACGTRSDPVRGQYRLAADSATLGHRAGRAAARARHPGDSSMRTGRRGEPAGPLCRSARSTRSPARRRSMCLAASLYGKSKIGLEYSAQALRPDEHVAFAARRLCAQLAGPCLWPNLEYHVQPLSLDAFGEPLHAISGFHRERLQSRIRRAAARCAIRTRRVPTTRQRSSPNYLSTDAGSQELRPARCDYTPSYRGAAGAGEVPTHRVEAGPAQYESDQDLVRLAGDIGTTIFHPVGTTKMGARLRSRWPCSMRA
jgi:hypothetical protein